MNHWRFLSPAAIAGASLVTVGCVAQVQPASTTVMAEEEVEVDAAPAVDVTTYPHTEYRGTTVYYVDGRWYRPRGHRWAYYRHEPPELERHRRTSRPHHEQERGK